MTEKLKIKFTVHYHRWFRAYLFGIECAAKFGLEPDWDKFEYWGKRGVYVKYERIQNA
jgi:hypothetical protein